MEYINKVEIKGKVGYARVNEVKGCTLIHLSVATSEESRLGDEIVIETTWHNCTYYNYNQSNKIEVKKGDNVALTGRIKNIRYTDANGDDKYISTIIVNTLTILSNEL